jgi:hypothetical protein
LKRERKSCRSRRPHCSASGSAWWWKRTIDARADLQWPHLRRQLEVELKQPLQRFEAVRVARIGAVLAAAFERQRLARQLIVPTRHFANQARGIGLLDAVGDLYLDLVAPLRGPARCRPG